jgi:peptidoglycan-associated lipoprotein
MRTRLKEWCFVIVAVTVTACTSTPLTQSDELAPTLVIRTSATTLWTTAEAEAAAKMEQVAKAEQVAKLAAEKRNRAAGITAQSERVASPSAGAAPAVQPKPIDVAKRVALIYFGFDSFEVNPEFGAVIEGWSTKLVANRDLRLVLEGHADERGGAEYNLALGQKRAQAIGNALTVLGVNEDQIEVISFGDTRPVDHEKSETAWAQNRRVEIKER